MVLVSLSLHSVTWSGMVAFVSFHLCLFFVFCFLVWNSGIRLLQPVKPTQLAFLDAVIAGK